MVCRGKGSVRRVSEPILIDGNLLTAYGVGRRLDTNIGKNR